MDKQLSALDEVNVRRLTSIIRKDIDGLLQQDLDSKATRESLKKAIESWVADVSSRVVPAWTVTCDSTNNSDADVAQGLLRVTIGMPMDDNTLRMLRRGGICVVQHADGTYHTHSMIQDWVALKHKSDLPGVWSVAPRSYWEEYARIPDGKTRIAFPGLEEVADHTISVIDSTDGRALLEFYGFEIIDNPVWYSDKPGYVQDGS